MRFDSYHPPVSKLITYGRPKPHQKPEQWPNYVQELGLSAEHIPELLRLMLDPAIAQVPSNHVGVWGSLHAWRSLGQLQSTEAIQPLLNLLGNEADDWVTDEIPWVYALIGPAALPVLQHYLKSSSKDAWGRMTTVSCLRAIAEVHGAEARPHCIDAMVTQLQAYRHNPPELNGLLVVELLELKATEAATAMEQAYAAHCVDELMAGTWPACQVALGLKVQSDFPDEAFTSKMPPELKEIKRLGRLGEMLSATEPPASLSDALPPGFSSPQRGFGQPQPGKKRKQKKKGSRQ